MKRTSVLPAVVIVTLCVVGAVFALAANVSAGTLRGVIIGITCGAVVMLVMAILTADKAKDQISSQLSAVRMQVRRGQEELQQMTEQVLRGEPPTAPAAVPPAGRVTSGDPLRLLSHELDEVNYTAGQAILQVAARTHGRSDQRVEIFVNLARRMQSLVHREIEMLDALEAQVEDPDLLKGLFTVDHLATRMRRQSESLAVLGGSASRRQWTRQVTMHEVLRAAVAEIEQYSRVKIVPPVEGVLRGAAVADVIHLIAELVENATKFSAPRTQALLRAQQVAAGVAIEIEDRGLGMLPPDQQRMNALLAEPGRIDIDELLRDGRIGLYVVSTLARRHGIRVQLQSNIYGGTSAVVVLPRALLQEGAERQLPRSGESGRELPGIDAAARNSGPLGGSSGSGSSRSAFEPAGTSSSGLGFGSFESGRDADRELVTAGGMTTNGLSGGGPSGTGGSGQYPGAESERYPGAESGRYARPSEPGRYSAPSPQVREYPRPQEDASAGLSGGGASGSGPRDSGSRDSGTGGSGRSGTSGLGGSYGLGDPGFSDPGLGGGSPAGSERPPLPKRQAQTSLAAQLRDSTPGTGPSRARSTEPSEDHTPGLMADFLRGINRSEEEDSWPGPDDTAH
jgi:signal transduction histidine kinase